MPALMEVVLSQVVGGEQTINRWNYLADGDTGSTTNSFGLIMALTGGALTGSPPAFATDTFMRRLQELQVTAVQFASIAVKNVYSTTDFQEFAFTSAVTGTIGTGDPAAPWIVYPFRTNIVRTDIGRGQKRISGVSEDLMGDFGAVGTSPTAEVTLFAEAMSETLTYSASGASLTFTPCVVKREKYQVQAPAMGVAERFAYRYYETFAEQAEFIASGVVWTPQARVSTQDSRKG